MANLTCAELLAYPGDTLHDKLRVQGEEARPAREVTGDPSRLPRRSTSALPRRVDIRRFPGRDRTERLMHYLRAHFPRAESWSESALRDLSAELLRSAEIVE
ncbi:MAG TPA: hypothetical protein VK524_29520 [Polyangiaceae bacterium]|nr:hypothetical protein [Polyangiaceae bacterium]